MDDKSTAGAGERARILVVEDDESQRLSILDILEQEGFEAQGCATGAEALACCEREGFAVAIVDLRLPDVEGTRLAGQLLGRDPELRVILNTAYGSFESARDALNLGAFGFVEKAGDPAEFVRRVHSAVNDRIRRYAARLEAAVAERTRELEAANVSLQAEIRAREETEAARDKEAERVRLLYQCAPICIHELDREGRLVAMNETGLRMMGLEREEEILGHDYLQLICEADREKVRRLFQTALRGGQGSLQFRIGEGDSERHFHSSMVPVRDQAGRVVGIIGHSEEVTEQVAAERRRHELVEQLRHTQKLEAVGTLAAGVAHDFNNVLTAILGYAELLQGIAPESEEVSSALAGIRSAGEQAVEVTRALLAFSGNSVGQKGPLDLNHVAEDAMKLLRRMLPYSIDIVTRTTAPEPVVVRGDKGQLTQVLMNLVVNARDAMPDGGQLSIEIGVERLGDEPRAFISVRDSGQGMPAEVQARVFEPFYTTKPRGKGTGLGLSVVHGIVTEHGGEIQVTSAEGLGTTISVLLPTCDSSPVAYVAEPVAELARGHGELVLLVEDDQVVRRLVQSVLSRQGYRVVEAINGMEGLERFREEADDFALVVLDEDMPRMKGTDCLARLRDRRPEIPAIVMSGMHHLDEVLSDEELVFLRKPFRIEELIAGVAGALVASRAAEG